MSDEEESSYCHHDQPKGWCDACAYEREKFRVEEIERLTRHVESLEVALFNANASYDVMRQANVTAAEEHTQLEHAHAMLRREYERACVTILEQTANLSLTAGKLDSLRRAVKTYAELDEHSVDNGEVNDAFLFMVDLAKERD